MSDTSVAHKKINVLDKLTAELIAAGEVVERPASVIKELLENAIDAGASMVTVEIKNGGVTFIRVTDNGCGIPREDVPVAFLRHATSKVRTQDDLDGIGTLGFRGEALASIAAVTKVELTTRTSNEMAGTLYTIEGGTPFGPEDVGCPQGTSIIVRDLFYNVPARMKFLKKDVSEGNAAEGIVDRIALSHPEVSVRFIRDGKEELVTPGDGQLAPCVYAVFGRDFAAGMSPLDYTCGGIHVHGLVCAPSSARANRTMQHFFINGRYVKIKTAMVALEEAYKGSIMTGKFPSCVMNIDMPLETVDVNVHPAKIEVRFVNERPIFDAVYHGVKTALFGLKTAEPVKLPDNPFKPRQSTADEHPAQHIQKPEIKPGTDAAFSNYHMIRDTTAIPYDRPVIYNVPSAVQLHPDVFPDEPDRHLEEHTAAAIEKPPVTQQLPEPQAQEHLWQETALIRLVGEAFGTYVVAALGNSLYFIDKHAAHERIIYNDLKDNARSYAQMLLEPITVMLGSEEYSAIVTHLEELECAGYEIEDFGGRSVLLRALPMMLTASDASAVIQEIAGGLVSGRREITTDKQDWIYHSTACRAAVKAGDVSSHAELLKLAERVLLNQDIRTCPHGRRVCFELTRRELEKQFGRIV